MRYILFFFLSLVTFSCQLKKSSESKLNIESDSILLINGVKQLLMDELDYPLSGHIRYYERNGKSYLVQGNESQKTIRVYDYHSGVKCYEEVCEEAKGEFFAYNSDTAFAIANGINIYTVSKLLGHQSIKVTEIYTDVLDSSLDNAMDKMNDNSNI